MLSRLPSRHIRTVLVLVLASLPVVAQDGLVITEFLAQNTEGLRDVDREYSDWFEVYNGGDDPVSLEGYHVTDTTDALTQWSFPAVTIASGEFLVVFASGKDRRDPDEELHTNFRIDKDGELLVLLTPDAQNVVSGFAPFPTQVADSSFGAAMDWTISTLLDGDAAVRAHVPGDDALGLSWTEAGFDDGGWTAGQQAVGYGGRNSEVEATRTDVGAEQGDPVMEDVNASVYIRIPFEVTDRSTIDTLRLRVRYDDGFVAYVNGQLAAAVNVDEPLEWNGEARRSHAGTGWEYVDITSAADALVDGTNVLAIHGLNTSRTNSDFFFLTELQAIDITAVRVDEPLYYNVPTPGEPNGEGFGAIAPAPEISHDDGVFTETQLVEISTDLEGAVIRYTLSGETPSDSSTLYEGPVEISGSSILTARVFHPDYLPGIPARRTFVLLDNGLSDWDTNLPIVIALTFGRPIGSSCEGNYTPGHFVVIEPGENGRARIVDEPSFTHSSGFRRRGSSTCGRSKFSFNVETRDDESQEEDTELFGWPEHADYAMYGPENFDRALIRNPFVYELSNQTGQYAPRTRFVELFLQQARGAVRSSNYHGLYVFMERNKRGPGRVDIDRLRPQHDTEPQVSGGYLMKVDRNDGVPTLSLGGLTTVPVQPKTLSAPQRSWLSAWMGRMRQSLDPNTIIENDGEFVDVRSWIDHHILNMYPMNVDAFRLSGYFFKPRNGPLHMGPCWDYDRSMESTDGRDDNPVSWGDTGGSSFFSFGWYAPLFGSRPPRGATAWERAYIDRWRELRGAELSTENIEAIIDGMADEIREAAARNFTRWRGVSPRSGPRPLNGTFQGEVDHMKNWLRRRAEWIDGHFVPVPTFSPESSVVQPGAEVTLSTSGDMQIFYTLDGEDPRDGGGRIGPSAVEYSDPIVINGPTVITARVFGGASLWSGPVTATYIHSMPRLAVSEFNYNPAPPTPQEDPADEFSATDMEFIEIKNVGSEPADLWGVEFERRTIVFGFQEHGGIDTLAPGETVVIANDLEGFNARYGSDGITVIGEYPSGSLSNTGENVRIFAPTGDTIVDFRYTDDWYPETDGGGFTMVNVDPYNLDADLDDASSWRMSDAPHGTPGVDDVAPTGGLRLPGDINGDGQINITDAVGMLRFLFSGNAVMLPCGDGSIDAPGNVALLDVDSTGDVNTTDAIYTLQFLFSSGPPPALGTDCTRMPDCENGCER